MATYYPLARSFLSMSSFVSLRFFAKLEEFLTLEARVSFRPDVRPLKAVLYCATMRLAVL
jgi:hypothetical protein